MSCTFPHFPTPEMEEEFHGSEKLNLENKILESLLERLEK